MMTSYHGSILQLTEDGPNIQTPLKSINTKATTCGPIAQNSITLNYKNTNDTAICSRFVFPVNSHSSIYSSTANVGGRTIVGRVKEKEEAQKEYEKEVDGGENLVLAKEANQGNQGNQLSRFAISSVQEREVNDGETQPCLMSFAVAYPQVLKETVLKETFKSELKQDYCFPKSNTTWEIGNIPVASSESRRSRTMFEVTGLSSAKIVHSIFTSNKARSIHAVYEGATVKCKTSSYMKFAIKLLLPVNEVKVVLVDVQRVSGCAMAFRDEYQAIQAVLHGNSTPRLHRAMTRFADLEFMVEEEIIERSIETSMVNLDSKIYDTRIISLQDLSLTTDPESKETFSRACKLILGKYSRILEYVVEDIAKKVEDTNIDDDSEEYLRSLSLKILGNILSLENINQSLVPSMEKSDWAITLIDSLVWYISMASMYPWNACLAAKCLRLLALNFGTAHWANANGGVEYALKNAKNYGNVSYELLEKEAQAALECLIY